MSRRIWHFSVVALIVAGLGCQHHSNTAANNKQPPDPLLISKKPVEGKPTSFEPGAFAWREPQAPARESQPTASKPVPVGYRPADDTGVRIGKPAWLPPGQ